MKKLARTQSALSKTDSMRHWKGKHLFVDLDGTMVSCRELPDFQKSMMKRGSFWRMVDVGIDKPAWYEIEQINTQAALGIDKLRGHGAMPMITSFGGIGYVSKVLDTACLASLFYSVHGYEDLLNPRDDGSRSMPKDFDKVIADIGEKNPLRNCVIIGNEPRLDVPISPMGIVSVLTTMDFDFKDISGILTSMLIAGNGGFAKGFDRMSGAGCAYGKIEMFSKEDWPFPSGQSGKARVVYCDREAVEKAATQPIYL